MPEPAKPHLLIVDEPFGLCRRRHGFPATLAPSSTAARRAVEEGRWTSPWWTWTPGEDGLSLTHWMAARGGPPVVLLTAMAEEADRVLGLELGADEYVVKPLAPRELCQACAPCCAGHPATVPAGRRRFAGWSFDPAARTCRNPGRRSAELTSGEARFLGVLLDRPRAVLSRDRLLESAAWRKARPFDRAIDDAVTRLRRKLEEDRPPARASSSPNRAGATRLHARSQARRGAMGACPMERWAASHAC